MAEKQPEGQLEDAKTQLDAASPDHSPEETIPSTSSDQSKESSSKASNLLRDLNNDLLHSGKFIVTGKLFNIYIEYSPVYYLLSLILRPRQFDLCEGTVDRLGRGLVITETHSPEESHHLNDIVQLLSCYYTITRYFTTYMAVKYL